MKEKQRRVIYIAGNGSVYEKAQGSCRDCPYQPYCQMYIAEGTNCAGASEMNTKFEELTRRISLWSQFWRGKFCKKQP